MSSMLNKKAVKAFALDAAKRLRCSWAPERFSASNYAFYEGLLRARIEAEITRHPTIGTTIYPPDKETKS
jgi:hypothetical protein